MGRESKTKTMFFKLEMSLFSLQTIKVQKVYTLPKGIKQHYPAELSAVKEMFCAANTVAVNHM